MFTERTNITVVVSVTNHWLIPTMQTVYRTTRL